MKTKTVKQNDKDEEYIATGLQIHYVINKMLNAKITHIFIIRQKIA